MYKKRLQNFFTNSKADALILHNGDSEGYFDINYRYFMGLEFDNSILLARRTGSAMLLCTSLNYDYAREKARVPVEKIERKLLPQQLKKFMASCKSIGINKRSLRLSTFEVLRKAGKGKKFMDVSEELGMNRAMKDGEELAIMKKCITKTRGILESVEVRAGMKEEDILKNLRVQALEAGADISFPPIVLSGPKASIPHGVTGGRRIGANEAVLIDFGLKMNGYCSDLTRCYFTGACKQERSIYEKLQNVQESLADYGHAGTRISEFVKKSDALIRQAGLPKLPHSIGHGLGLYVHEAPSLCADSKKKFEAGMTLAIEPSYYGKKFGLRYENDFVVGGKKLRML
ncbi:MAG: Xaa-Pro peptidase family protein [Candidatus Burarchaeum sp.]|nr:Xaa-Pro peptidase family protein [Candidatus Burarchaeum sp.]MDO8339499.1 Xaa-Pro peptidase family protein [Candidatus Burarchaeum sp.]